MRKITGARLRRALALALLHGLITTRSSLAANIVIDGQSGDWAGEPTLTDPAGYVTPERAAPTTFYRATNPGDPTTYFMIQRSYPGGQGNAKVYCYIWINTNRNGSYSVAVGHAVYVSYDPSQNPGNTTMDVCRGNNPGQAGSLLASYSGNWRDPQGAAPNGGTRSSLARQSCSIPG